jgi:Icc protein
MIVLAHVSDIHIDDRRSVDRATKVMHHLNTLPGPIDAVLVTGDLADHGLASEYLDVAKVLDSHWPVLHLPGNHDVRGPYREVLLDSPASPAPINQVAHVGGAVFALCDSSIPGRPDGYLDDATLAWLESVLAESGDAPVFVCFHHPPVRLHMPYVDGIRQNGEERLAAVVSRYPNVVALLCGHAHTGAWTTFAGLPLLVAPGVVSTSLLPWEAEEEFSLDKELPPAIAFHILDDDRRLTTHYRVVPLS